MPAAPRAKSASYTSLSRPLDPAFIRAQTERLERQRRAEAALARAEASLARMQRARQHLPLRFPDPQEAAALRPTLWPEGFRRETDPAGVARVHEALSKAPRFAAALDTDPHDRRWRCMPGCSGSCWRTPRRRWTGAATPTEASPTREWPRPRLGCGGKRAWTARSRPRGCTGRSPRRWPGCAPRAPGGPGP